MGGLLRTILQEKNTCPSISRSQVKESKTLRRSTEETLHWNYYKNGENKRKNIKKKKE